MIRVALVDDQTLMREGLKQLLALADDVEIVAEASDGVEAIECIARSTPDVVLLDVQMPRCSGIEVLRALQATNRLPPTILLTTFDDDSALLEGMRAGARGFLLKDVSLADLRQAIAEVATGASLLRPAVTERILKAALRVDRSFDSLDLPDRLSKRELETLRFMAAGHNNRDIADAFGTTEGTVKNHVSNILSKFGVKSRTQAVLKGMELGYLGVSRKS